MTCETHHETQRNLRLKSTALLTPIEVDFKKNESHRQKRRKEIVEYEIDNIVDTYNRVAYNHNVIFVHCAMGVSRSASCVIMYIMKKFRIGFEDALEFVRTKRSIVEPNEGFQR